MDGGDSRTNFLLFRNTRRRWPMEISAPRPAGIRHERDIDRRVPANSLHRRIDRAQELLAKPCPATLVSKISFGDIELSFRRTEQLKRHNGRALFVSHLPRTIPKPGFSEDSLSCAPTRVSASRGPAPLPECPQGRPKDLRRVEASLPGLDQRSIQCHSFESLYRRLSQNPGPPALLQTDLRNGQIPAPSS